MTARHPNCVLCGVAFTPKNQSREHIIPAAIGGRRTVAGLLCRTCNNDTGNTWDAELARTLQELSLILDVQRQRGRPPSKVVGTVSGSQIRLLPGIRQKLAKPSFQISKDSGERVASITVGSERELRAMLNNINKRYNKNLDVERIVAENPVQPHYINDPMRLNLGLGGVYSDKSMAKSALAMAAYAGVAPQDAPLVLAYLRGSAGLRCIDPYYVRDPVLNRVPGMPLNCVHVAGDPRYCRLVAYVEIYGVLKRIVCLSDAYAGDSFEDYYAFDPTDGSAQTIHIDLDPSTVNPSGNESFDQTTIDNMCQALSRVLQKALAASRENETSRLIRAAFDEFYASTGKNIDDPLSDDEAEALTVLILSRIEPFLLHLIQPGEVPAEEVHQLYQTDQ